MKGKAMSVDAVSPRTHGPMRNKAALILGAIAAVLVFAAGPMLFIPSHDMPTMTGFQLPLALGVAVIEALAFGAGLAFALVGRAAVARVFSSGTRTVAVHLAVTWALISWWLHDGLHFVNGLHINGFLAIEYGFHVTLIIAAAAVAWAVISEARSRTS